MMRSCTRRGPPYGADLTGLWRLADARERADRCCHWARPLHGRRSPDPLTAAAPAGHLPGHLGRAAIGAVALAGFYLVLAVIRPGGLGLGDTKLAASVGAALGWISWQALLSGTFAAFVLARMYGRGPPPRLPCPPS